MDEERINPIDNKKEDDGSGWGGRLFAAAIVIILLVTLALSVNTCQRLRDFEDNPLGMFSRDFDTVFTGTTANDGTGIPIRTAFGVLNAFIRHANTIGWDNVTAQDILNMRHIVDSLNIHLDINDTAAMLNHYALLSEIGAAANVDLDSITINGAYALLFDGADTSAAYVPHDLRDDAATLFPTIQSAAGDTSNYTIPDKIGDLYIDTSAGKVYVSVAATRGGWRILNYILPLFIVWNVKRRRRK